MAPVRQLKDVWHAVHHLRAVLKRGRRRSDDDGTMTTTTTTTTTDNDTEWWWWTGGVMDGDGCVRVRTGSLRPRVEVSVNQAARGAGLLHALADRHGGKIYASSSSRASTERHQNVYRWELAGPRASAFCQAVAPFTRLKRPQFEAAATGAHAETLRAMKTEAHAAIRDAPEDVPLAYVAGIVDTDGSLDVRPYTRVLVSQKHPAICDFLERKLGGTTYAYARRAAHEWRLTGEAAMELVEDLRGLLRSKGAQAELVLSVRGTATRSFRRRRVHAALQTLKGNQNKTRKKLTSGRSPRS
jgi:hypothetical protein